MKLVSYICITFLTHVILNFILLSILIVSKGDIIRQKDAISLIFDEIAVDDDDVRKNLIGTKPDMIGHAFRYSMNS